MRIRTAPVLTALFALAIMLSWLQFRWVATFTSDFRERTMADMYAVHRSVGESIDLEIGRLLGMIRLSLGVDNSDSAAAAAVQTWKLRNPLAPIFGSIAVNRDTTWTFDAANLIPARIRISSPGRIAVLQVDTAMLLDSVLPMVVNAAAAERQLDIEWQLMVRSPDGSNEVVSGMGVAGEFDVERELLGSLTGANSISGGGLTWTFVKEGEASAGPGVYLRIRHPSGSVAIASRNLMVRNLAGGFAVLALLLLTASLAIANLRREARIESERAALIAGVSHELRTPLSAIQTAAENIREGLVTSRDDLADYGQIIEEQSERLIGTVEQTLAVARTLGRGDRPSVEPVDLRQTAETVLTGLDANGQVLLDCPYETVIANRSILHVVMGNLVDNAIKHGDVGEPVTLSLELEEGMLAICVSNSGRPVNKTDLRRLVMPFERGNQKAGGVGLGLTLVYKLVELSGGQLTVRSGRDLTTFVVELPLDA